MGYIVYVSLLLAITLNVESVTLGVDPPKAEEGSKLTLVCSTDGGQGWIATWYRNNEKILILSKQQGDVCDMMWIIPQTGVFSNTKAECVKNFGIFFLTLLHVTRELNNTRWRCDIDGQSSPNETLVIKTPTATLRLSPDQVKLGSRLDIICEYPEPARSSTWYKDAEKVLYIQSINESTCMEERSGMNLSDIRFTCPQNSKNSTFVLTFLKVKQDLNGTIWDCLIDNNTVTGSGSKTIVVLAESATSKTGMKDYSESTTPSFLIPAVVGAGCAVILVIIVAVVLFARKRRLHSYIDNDSSVHRKEESKPNGPNVNKQSLVIQENELYETSAPNDVKTQDHADGLYTMVNRSALDTSVHRKEESKPNGPSVNKQSLVIQENELYETSAPGDVKTQDQADGLYTMVNRSALVMQENEMYDSSPAPDCPTEQCSEGEYDLARE